MRNNENLNFSETIKKSGFYVRKCDTMIPGNENIKKNTKII